MPGIIQQMGSDITSLQRFAAQMKSQAKAGGAAGAAADDDDVPALVENFDAVAKNPAAGATTPAAGNAAGNKPTPVTSVD
jgi:predicted lipid-binding transport protein (Tim44 family)